MIRSKSKKGKVWKYVHTEDVWIRTNIKGKDFSKPFLEIDDEGCIKVKGSYDRGYAWDGCSPKFEALHFLVGTPDGKLDYETIHPITYFASMVHDALYQYKKEIGISRRDADRIFILILKEAKFMWWWLYGVCVVLFGGVYGGRWGTKDSQKHKVEIFEYSWRLED